MEAVKDNSKVPESYWDDQEKAEIDKKLEADLKAERLYEGIDLKDLCDGERVPIEYGYDYDDDDDDEKEDDFDDDENEVIFHDLKAMREKRGAPPPDKSFEEIAKGMTNVTENGFVKKEIITHGTGKLVPDFAYVKVHYSLYKTHCEAPFDSTYFRHRPGKFRLDQGELIEGLEQAIKSMRKNENSMFYIKWEVAFGPLGCPDRIGEKCDIMADVTLLDFADINAETHFGNDYDDESRKTDFNNTMRDVKYLFCCARDEFSSGETNTAVLRYKRALSILNDLLQTNKEGEKREEMLQEKVRCLINLAVCYNKLGRPKQACVACREALAIDCNNVKAYFHYGRANMALSDLAAAERCLMRAFRMKPDDIDVNKELIKLQDKKAAYKLEDKKFWVKAFEGVREEKEEHSSGLDSFEKSLKTSLEECTKETEICKKETTAAKK